MTFKTIQEMLGYESAEAEQARLAEAPEHSLNHWLSGLEVQIRGVIDDRLIQLPRQHDDLRVVVVPITRRPASESVKAEQPRRLYADWWECAVVASEDPRYPVGGYRLSIPEAELRRGSAVDLITLLGSQP